MNRKNVISKGKRKTRALDKKYLASRGKGSPLSRVSVTQANDECVSACVCHLFVRLCLRVYMCALVCVCVCVSVWV